MVGLLREPGRAIFNLHCPPYGSKLDDAPALDEQLRPLYGGQAVRPVGSTAVRDAILRYQPMLSLHGHIHESRGVARLGRTLALNPGSSYESGVLHGAIVEVDAKRGVRSYMLVTG
jgi:Icc-related predicted phosphoesterase